MEKRYIFLPILLFFVLKDNAVIFSSNTNRSVIQNSGNLYDPEAEDKVITDLTGLNDELIIFDQETERRQAEKAKKATFEAQKKAFLDNIKNNYTHLIPSGPIIGGNSATPVSLGNPTALQDATYSNNNFIPSSAYSVPRSIHQNSLNASPAARSSNTNSQPYSQNTNHQALSIEQAAYANMSQNLFTLVDNYFIRRAHIDAQAEFNNRVNANTTQPTPNFYSHLAKFGLTAASSDKSPVNLGPIGENVQNFTHFNGHRFPYFEDIIRNKLKLHSKKTYYETFNNQLRNLKNQQQ